MFKSIKIMFENEIDEIDECDNTIKTNRTNKSKYENNITFESIDRSFLIYDDSYNYLNTCVRSDTRFGTNTKNVLLMYNNYMPEFKFKEHIQEIIDKKTKSPETEIYYCMKSETDPVTQINYERTYVLIISKKIFKSNPSNYDFTKYQATMRLIDKRDIARLKVFMASGDHYYNDMCKMNEIRKNYSKEIAEKKPNSGNNKIIKTKKTRFEYNESSIKINDYINLPVQDCNSCSTMSKDTNITESVNSKIDEKITKCDQKINGLRRKCKEFNEINEKLNYETDCIKTTLNYVDIRTVRISENLELIKHNFEVIVKDEVDIIKDKLNEVDSLKDKVNNVDDKFNEVETLKKEIENLKLSNLNEVESLKREMESLKLLLQNKI